VFEMGNYLVTRKNHKETQTDMQDFNVEISKTKPLININVLILGI
jgi:hypothetical protein